MILHHRLTHATVLTEDFDEIKGVETEQQHQLVLTFSVITGSLLDADRKRVSDSDLLIHVVNKKLTTGKISR